MKMKRATFLAVVFTTVCCAFAGPTSGKKKAKELDVRRASSGGTVTKRPKKINGKVAFDGEVDVALNIVGRKEKKVKLKKVDVGPNNPGLASKMHERSAVYANEGNTVVCRKDCDDTGDCEKIYCMEHDEDKSCYVSGDKATCMDNDPAALVDMVMPDIPVETKVHTDNSSRRRRSLFPDMASSGIIRLIYHPDAEFMKVFQVIADGDATAAKTEVTKFAKLVTNEMTISYQTLNEYNLEYTLKGRSYNLAFVVYVAHIEFPEISENAFINVRWSETSLDADNALPASDTLSAFRTFIRTYSAPVGVDHHAALTGYELAGSTIGIAYFETLCRVQYKNDGQTTSLSERFPLMATLLAHELGHSIGADHDSGSNNCEEKTYVMSGVVSVPNSLNKNSYFKFSICSANDIRLYLSSIRSRDLDSECLVNSGVTDEDYFKDFCLGFRGTGMTLEEICKAGYGDSSTVCNGIKIALLLLEALAESGYVEDCLRSYGCTDVDGSCVDIEEVPPGTKCTTDSTLGDKICFNGDCAEGIQVCPDALPTQPPATDPPCSCTTGKCCRKSGKPCCAGCFENRRGVCKLI